MIRPSLDYLGRRRVRTLHVQLLASGPDKEFQPWFALVQMLRAYGQWYRAHECNRMRVRLYVVDPALVLLLRGGFRNPVEHLDDTPLYVRVRVVPHSGQPVQYDHFARPTDKVGSLLADVKPPKHGRPTVSVEPVIEGQSSRDEYLATARSKSLEDFGLVSGSILVLRYAKS